MLICERKERLRILIMYSAHTFATAVASIAKKKKRSFNLPANCKATDSYVANFVYSEKSTANILKIGVFRVNDHEHRKER